MACNGVYYMREENFWNFVPLQQDELEVLLNETDTEASVQKLIDYGYQNVEKYYHIQLLWHGIGSLRSAWVSMEADKPERNNTNSKTD